MRRMRTWNLVSGILKRRMLQQALGVFDMLFIYTSYKLHESFSHNIYNVYTNGLHFFKKIDIASISRHILFAMLPSFVAFVVIPD